MRQRCIGDVKVQREDRKNWLLYRQRNVHLRCSSKYSPSTRDEILDWAVAYMETTVAREARRVTESRELQTSRKPVTGALVRSFSLSNMCQTLEEDLAPVSMQILTALATSRHASKHTDRRKERTKKVYNTLIPYEVNFYLPHCNRSSPQQPLLALENIVMLTTLLNA